MKNLVEWLKSKEDLSFVKFDDFDEEKPDSIEKMVSEGYVTLFQKYEGHVIAKDIETAMKRSPSICNEFIETDLSIEEFMSERDEFEDEWKSRINNFWTRRARK